MAATQTTAAIAAATATATAAVLLPKPSSRPPPPPLTHFLCIPLVTPSSRPQLARSLAAFRADVASPQPPLGGGGGGSDPVVPEDAIRPVGTLHLTLGMFSFPRDAPEGAERLDKARSVLKGLRAREIWKGVELDRRIPGTGTGLGGGDMMGGGKGKGQGGGDDGGGGGGGDDIRISLRGLRSMQATSPAKSTVLYAPPVDPLGRLQRFCERLRGAFEEEEGLMLAEDRPLLLHATVVNTVYVKGRDKGGGGGIGGQSKGRGKGRGKGGKGRRERLTIDAREILDRYEDTVWMEDVRVEKIAICRMGAKKVEVDGVVVDEAYEVEEEVDV